MVPLGSRGGEAFLVDLIELKRSVIMHFLPH